MGKEYFRQNSGDHTGSFSRNSYAPYLSYTKNWNQRFSTILGARANLWKRIRMMHRSVFFFRKFRLCIKSEIIYRGISMLGKHFKCLIQDLLFMGLKSRMLLS